MFQKRFILCSLSTYASFAQNPAFNIIIRSDSLDPYPIIPISKLVHINDNSNILHIYFPFHAGTSPQTSPAFSSIPQLTEGHYAFWKWK